MIVVDTHVHVALHTYEPAEMLLTQMQYNDVQYAVLVQSSTTTDNSYVIECMRRFPRRLAVVCRVDVDSPSAVDDLERWRNEGAESVRLRNFNRSPGEDPLAHLAKSCRTGHERQRRRPGGWVPDPRVCRYGRIAARPEDRH
jgi:predicted TIM-barrel fold metal-dependent hydrolase